MPTNYAAVRLPLCNPEPNPDLRILARRLLLPWGTFRPIFVFRPFVFELRALYSTEYENDVVLVNVCSVRSSSLYLCTVYCTRNKHNYHTIS